MNTRKGDGLGDATEDGSGNITSVFKLTVLS